MPPRAKVLRHAWRQFIAFQRKNNGFAILQRYYERHLTPTGKAFLLLQTVSLSLGLVGTEVLIYMVMCALMGLWISVIFMGWCSRPRPWQLEKLNVPHFTAHQTQDIFWQVGYEHRWPVFQVQLEVYLVPSQGRERLRLRSTQTHEVLRAETHFVTPWTPRHRGQYALRSVSLISVFPLQLLRWRRVKPLNQNLWVYPEITLPPQGGKGASTAPPGALRPHQFARSQAEHLAGTRPWRSGDSPRLIHWAGFARTGQLTVKEFQQAQRVTVGLVLGGGALADPEDFEDALSLMAGFLQQQTLAESDAYELAFLQVGDRLHTSADAKDYWQALSLAQQQDEVSWSQWGKHWPQVSRVIYVGVRVPPTLAVLFQQLQQHGIALQLYVPRSLALEHEQVQCIPHRQHRGGKT